MLYDLKYSDFSLTFYDVGMANGFVFMNLVANIMFSYGIKYGYAGRIQAIDSGQIIVQLVFAIMIWGQYPLYEDYVGAIFGFVGILIICL